MGGGRKGPARATGPRCRGGTQVFACPIDRRLRLCSREGTQHLFVVVRRRSCVASGVLKFGGAAAGGGASQARAVCAACWAACARVVVPLLCSCGRCCGGVCAATLVAVGARAVGGARAVDAGRACWVSCGGRGRPVPSPWAGRGATGLAVCVRPPCSCARDVVVAAAGVRRRGRSRVPRRLVHAHGVAGGARGTAARGAVAVLAWRWR